MGGSRGGRISWRGYHRRGKDHPYFHRTPLSAPPPSDPTSFIQLHSAARGQRKPTDKLLLTCPGEPAPTNPASHSATRTTKCNSLISYNRKVFFFLVSNHTVYGPKGKVHCKQPPRMQHLPLIEVQTGSE